MDGVIFWIGMFLLLYPIVISIIAFKLNKSRYRQLLEMVADLRKSVV